MNLVNTNYPLNKPIDKTTIKTIYNFSIDNVRVFPFEKAIITVLLCDENDKFIEASNLIMNVDDYSNWKNDDTYLIEWVKNQISA